MEVTTAASGDVISLDELKVHLRVDHADEDRLIDGYLRAATAMVERYTRRAPLVASYRQRFDAWPKRGYRGVCLLQRDPVVDGSVSVKYLDEDDAEQTLATTYYRVLADRRPAEIWFDPDADVLPELSGDPGAVRVEYQAGSTSTPPELRSAVMMLAAQLYANREATTDGFALARDVPHTYRAFLDSLSLPEV